MNTKKVIIAGCISGLVMGVILFLSGAIVSRIVYGPQFAPDGKFDPSQLNPFYFIWTKIVIGIFFGLLFTMLYEKLPLTKKISSCLKGLQWGFVFWIIVSLWSISHPLVYGSFQSKNELFWSIYSLSGFLALGCSFGFLCKKWRQSPIIKKI